MNHRGRSAWRSNFPVRAHKEWTGHYEIVVLDAPIASGPIPEGAMRLGKGSYSVYTAIKKTPTVLLSVPKIEESMGCRIKDDDDKVREAVYARGRITPEEEKRVFPWERAANLFFLSRLMAGELTAYVRDPRTGESLQLSPEGWLEEIEDLCFSPRNDEGCVAPHAQSLIQGAYQTIFLWRHEFERWFQKTFGSDLSKRRGRKPGSGSMEKMDEPFLEKMRGMMESGTAKSPEDAAGQVAKSAPGASVESTQTRLAKRYRKRFPSERN
jgi:hypothetical protein